MQGLSTILATILITAPLAFLVGWLLSKTVFIHLANTRPKSVAPGEQDTVKMPAPAEASKTQLTPNIQKAVRGLQQQLATSKKDCQSLQTETQLLKEAVAEREHRLLELKQQLSTTAIPPEEVKAGTASLENVQYGKDKRALEKRINTHQHEIAKLRRELITVENKNDTAKSRSQKWRSKLKPLARQFRQQRMIISELREELRQRELNREQEAVEHQRELNAITSALPAEPKATTPVAASEPLATAPAEAPPPVEQRDNLKSLKGIGPALQKKLYNQGIFRLQQLAEMNIEELTKLGKSLGVSEKLINKNDWSKQARELLGLAENSTETATQSSEEAVPA
jgi:predicted flap endonuclease-1-like 5' DNA nuclease